MVTREILMSHPIKYLRDEVRKANIMGFLTTKKEKLVDEMMKRKEMFMHIKPSGRKGKVSYVGRKRATPKKQADADKKALSELKKTKAGRLAILRDKVDRLPKDASKGKIEALKAQLRAEKGRR